MKDYIFKWKNYILRYSAYKKYKNLISNDNKSIEEIEQINWNKRKNIVEYAYENIPFYRTHYDKNHFHPKHLKNMSDWEKVPYIQKQDIRDNYSDFINTALSLKRHVSVSTGGTTGVPLRLIHDKKNYNDVNSWRVMKWWNNPVSPNIGFVFRLTRTTKLSRLINKIIWFPTKRVFLDASSISNEEIDEFIKRLKRNKIILLQGYTGSLNEIAKYVITNNIKLPHIKTVWCTSSPLTKNIRNTLNKAFNAEVFDQYGSSEVYWLATECGYHNGLHIHSDIRHIDIVDDHANNVKKGTIGNILVTDLDNYLFPIIKYKNGDLSKINPEFCKCGKPYPLLDKIYGRITDNIKLPSGGFVSGDYFTTIFDDYADEIHSFQIHQKNDYSIDINVKIKSSMSDTVLKNIKKTISNKTNSEVKIRINKVINIDNVKNGKSRFVISDIL